jgi:hypothetical protein
MKPNDSEMSQQVVQALLAASGVTPPDDEVRRLAGLYPALRASVDRFHAVDVGDDVTAAVFGADVGADFEADVGGET